MAEREWFEKDFYKVLGVAATATDKEITRAYRKLAKTLHPDTNPGSEERFKEVSAAYDVLGDATKRAEYDQVRTLGPAAGGPRFTGPGGVHFGGDAGDMGDLFANLFGSGGGFGGRRPRAERGVPLDTALQLNFRDAVFGVATAVNLPSEDPCGVCHGFGSAPGTNPVSCERCAGSGVIDDNQGPFSLREACPSCHGSGRRIVTPCPSCHGTGRQLSSRKVQVRIPAGVESGQRIKVKGKGGPGVNGGPPGDLFVDVRVAPDARFGRKGRHVTTTVDVSVTEALLGTAVSVPTLDDPVTLKIAAGTQPGTTLRVKGRGVPAVGRHPQGDLLVHVRVVVPTELTREQVQLVQKLDAALKKEA
jgi:molecular chaperone DnaJ